MKKSAVAFVLFVALLTLAPFAAALEVHHALAEADHDGHQHSEFDLCQWVQLHSASSIDLGPAATPTPAPPQQQVQPAADPLPAGICAATALSRGPPFS
jgi:hypothetical protein